jgi:ankyrin repeat protein
MSVQSDFSERNLRVSASRGDVAFVLRLLRGGIDPVAAHELTGETALHKAAAMDHLDVMQVLLQAGADPQARLRIPSAWRPVTGVTAVKCPPSALRADGGRPPQSAGFARYTTSRARRPYCFCSSTA